MYAMIADMCIGFWKKGCIKYQTTESHNKNVTYKCLLKYQCHILDVKMVSRIETS